jgi:hypothetical protein
MTEWQVSEAPLRPGLLSRLKSAHYQVDLNQLADLVF